MREYSGFIEFYFDQKQEYHQNAVKLNCARQGINYVILARGYQKIFIPHYICKTVYDVLPIDYEFYYLDENLLPKIDVKKIGKNAAILYPNYFGCNDEKVLDVISRYKNVIIDNTQAFYQRVENADVVYSPRKFFWVTDGAYVYCKKPLKIELEQDFSYQRMEPLFKRIELGSNSAYAGSLENENQITQAGMKKMSLITSQILASIDYKKMAQIRRKNFSYLESKLGKVNEMKLELGKTDVPMTYPFLLKSDKLRSRLIANKIYVPQWWKETLNNVTKDSFEAYLSNYLLPLPIDHRYGKEDLDFIADIVGQ